MTFLSVGRHAALAALGMGLCSASFAAGEDLLRAELERTRTEFAARVASLEARIAELERDRVEQPPVEVEHLGVAAAPQPATEYIADATPEVSRPNEFNPQMSLILAGQWNHFPAEAQHTTLRGFMPGGHGHHEAQRGFDLGESEVTLSASIDPLFRGQATFAVTPDGEVEAEEAFVATTALAQGFTAQFGRFFSQLGYVNTQHAHAWDFVDTPLVYTAMFGGQYHNEGLQLKWLAPLDTFVELGIELGNGKSFPGADNGNGVGSYTLFASTGNDIGDSASWKAGLSWLHADAQQRELPGSDEHAEEDPQQFGFSGDSDTWGAFVVYKWAPYGNSRERNFRFQAEYFGRKENGLLAELSESAQAGQAGWRSRQSGWYAQGIYQFRPNWRIGLRYEELDSGTPWLESTADEFSLRQIPQLLPYDPSRGSLMLDYSPTEYSRLRLQYSREDAAPGVRDSRLMLQYLMSLGAHGAHQF